MSASKAGLGLFIGVVIGGLGGLASAMGSDYLERRLGWGNGAKVTIWMMIFAVVLWPTLAWYQRWRRDQT